MGLRRQLLAIAGLAVLLAGASAAVPAARSALGSALHESLLRIEGAFVWNAARQGYLFSDRPGLAALLSPSPEASLPALVACLDDPRPARATLDGRAVTLGVVCYQALRLVAYVEAPDVRGEAWPGHIGPLAAPDERLVARRAWEAALAEGRYLLH